jgi:uncharacterized membrane protein
MAIFGSDHLVAAKFVATIVPSWIPGHVFWAYLTGAIFLGCALGRVVIFDVWKLETLYRILSFMALGIVLLVLGFLYNKYQEKIREWL